VTDFGLKKLVDFNAEDDDARGRESSATPPPEYEEGG
jgi:hypothetical protein